MKGLKAIDSPQMKSGLSIAQDGYGNIIPNALGYMMSKGNNLVDSNTGVCLHSSTARNAHGLSVLAEEVEKSNSSIFLPVSS